MSWYFKVHFNNKEYSFFAAFGVLVSHKLRNSEAEWSFCYFILVFFIYLLFIY